MIIAQRSFTYEKNIGVPQSKNQDQGGATTKKA
jgi:hypothetical protein